MHDPLRQIHQHAVAHLGGVVQAQDRRRRRGGVGEVLEQALAPEAAHGVLADRPRAGRSHAIRRLVAGTRPYTLPVENATMRLPAYRSATSTGTAAFIAHVRRFLAGGPELPAGHVHHEWAHRAAARRPARRAGRSGSSRSPQRSSPSWHARVAEPGHPDDAPRRPPARSAALRAIGQASGPSCRRRRGSTMSPGSWVRAATACSDGSLSRSSSSSVSWIDACGHRCPAS